MPSREVPLTELTPDNVTVADLPRFPGMTGWFNPGLLSKLLLRVIVSDLFGQYADRRLIHAALDTVSQDELLKRADLTAVFEPEDGAIWLDYVADLGDGFDATYAVAYLLAQKSLTVDGHVTKRGAALVMGGDEVYPTATRNDYAVRLRKPYSFALPDVAEAPHPPVLMLPGNHDWYDGLVNFLAFFCREKSTPVGAWRSCQRRSYFAAKLTDDWWLWCIDIALVKDMDQPQANYFVAMAEAMKEGANIILCSAEPGWYKADPPEESYRSLSYAAWLARNAKKNLRIPLILSGDTHHYARYSGCGVEYITAGGGGAFVHGTLDLKDELKPDLYKTKDVKLSLKTTADETHQPSEQRACYPSQKESRQMLNGNWRFAALNPEFSAFLGGVYASATFALTSLPRWDVALLIYLALLGGFFAYTGYQEGFKGRIFGLSVVHSAAHVAAIALLCWITTWLAEFIIPVQQWHWLPWFGFVAAMSISVGSPIAGTLFGLYLLVSCKYFGINNNDAFSSLKLDSHRHFLRIRIQGDRLEVYPIALDRVPARHEWVSNPKRACDKTESVFALPDHVRPRLIEGPVVISARKAPAASEVKAPKDVPAAS
jgi:hypothetical protein